MSTKITVNYQDKNYILEYSRESIRQIEKMGFIYSQIDERPVTMIPLLVYGAFLKNHRTIKFSFVEEIFDNLVGKVGDENTEGFIQVISGMYAEAIKTLAGDAEASESGNTASWTVMKG